MAGPARLVKTTASESTVFDQMRFFFKVACMYAEGSLSISIVFFFLFSKCQWKIRGWWRIWNGSCLHLEMGNQLPQKSLPLHTALLRTFAMNTQACSPSSSVDWNFSHIYTYMYLWSWQCAQAVAKTTGCSRQSCIHSGNLLRPSASFLVATGRFPLMRCPQTPMRVGLPSRGS